MVPEVRKKKKKKDRQAEIPESDHKSAADREVKMDEGEDPVPAPRTPAPLPALPRLSEMEKVAATVAQLSLELESKLRLDAELGARGDSFAPEEEKAAKEQAGPAALNWRDCLAKIVTATLRAPAGLAHRTAAEIAEEAVRSCSRDNKGELAFAQDLDSARKFSKWLLMLFAEEAVFTHEWDRIQRSAWAFFLSNLNQSERGTWNFINSEDDPLTTAISKLQSRPQLQFEVPALPALIQSATKAENNKAPDRQRG